MRSLIKIFDMGGPRIEPWGIPVKISIHSLIADPIFTLWSLRNSQEFSGISKPC